MVSRVLERSILNKAVADANMTYAEDKSARIEDINGWVEIKDNPLSKVGVFPYLGSSIDRDGALGLDPDKIYQVLRPEDELNNDECIDSFRLLPWINDHEMLGGEMTPAEQKGVEGVIGDDVYYDKADQTLKGNIKVFSESLKDSINFGKEELSCGYRCRYEVESGNFNGERYDIVQRKIRGNHLALVDQGRMGPDVAVLDETERLKFTIDSKEIQMDPKENEGAEGMSPSEVTAALKELMAKVAEIAAAMESTKEEAEVEDAGGNGRQKEGYDEEEKPSDSESMDSAEDVKAVMQAKIDSMQEAMDNMGKDLMGQISKRDALASNISDHVGTFDHSEMTLAEVAKYGVDKLAIACDSGEEVAAITGYLHNRKPAEQANAMDAGVKSSAIENYIKGER